MFYSKILLSLLLVFTTSNLYGGSVLTRNTSSTTIRARAILVFHLNLFGLDNEVVVPNNPSPTVKVGDKCPECKGTGKQSTDGIVKLPCVHCDGDGRVDKGDPILGEDSDPEPQKKKVNPLAKPSHGTQIIQDNWGRDVVDTYSFRMGGQIYYYVEAPNKFYCPYTKQYFHVAQNWFKTPNYSWKKCWGTWCEYPTIKKTQVSRDVIFPATKTRSKLFDIKIQPSFDETEYSSPIDTVERALAELNPKSHETFIDIGSGEGRVVILAALKYGCKSIGIEVDPEKIEQARKNAEKAGVSHLVTFIEGDFNKIQWPRADVGYVYLFEKNLGQIRNKLLGLDRFASYAHQVPNLPMHSRNNREFYLWDYDKVFTVWDGQVYYGRPKRGCNCTMCTTVVARLNEQKSHRN